VAQGFPLLKRNFLGENVGTPDLGRWKERVLAHVPDAPVELFERNLRRVAPADKLDRTSRVHTQPNGLVDFRRRLSKKEFRVENRVSPRFDHWWAFPVPTGEPSLTGNERAIFEEVRHDPSIRKIVLTRSREVDLAGDNVVMVPLDSRSGQELLVRAGHVFVRHSADLTFPWELDMAQHRVIDVGAGLPRPRANSQQHPLSLSPTAPRRGPARPERHVVVTTSSLDAMPVETRDGTSAAVEVWATGQPRHAFLLRPEDHLPDDLRAELADLRAEIAGRRFVLWLPAGGTRIPGLGGTEIAVLADWAQRTGTVLGVRSNLDGHLFTDLDPLLLMPRRFPDVEMLLREADLLVTDNSHYLADFLLTGSPVVVLDGADAEQELPGPVCRTGADLVPTLERALAERTPEEMERYVRCRDHLVGPADDGAAHRVVEQVRRASLSDPAPPPTVRVPNGRRPARA
jgi:hypothetical protein